MKAIQYFTDSSNSMSKNEIFPSLRMQGAKKLKFGDKAYSNFLGFGVAITPSSCYELNLMEKSERKALLEKIYGKGGIGLSVGRLCIGSSDYSAELYSYDDVEFDISLEHFSVEKDEKYVIPMIKEILEINPDLYLFASPWSPPYWMKTGESMCGGYMRREYIDCYADYIIKFIEAYAKHGIRISALTPQNEVNTQQNGRMPACIWHPEIEAEFIKALKKKFVSKKLDIKIWMFDHNFADANRVLWLLDNDKKLKDSTDGIAFHYYSGSIDETFEIQEKYPDIKLNFTEGGPRLYDNYDCDFCKWGIMISKVLNGGYNSFTGWNLMLNELGGPNIGPFFCGGLATRNSVTGELNYSGQYKAFKHIVPYIESTSKIYAITQNKKHGRTMSGYPNHSEPIYGFLIKNANQTVLVLINPDGEKRQTQINIDNTNYYIELSPESISTVII